MQPACATKRGYGRCKHSGKSCHDCSNRKQYTLQEDLQLPSACSTAHHVLLQCCQQTSVCQGPFENVIERLESQVHDVTAAYMIEAPSKPRQKPSSTEHDWTTFTLKFSNPSTVTHLQHEVPALASPMYGVSDDTCTFRDSAPHISICRSPQNFPLTNC